MFHRNCWNSLYYIRVHIFLIKFWEILLYFKCDVFFLLLIAEKIICNLFLLFFLASFELFLFFFNISWFLVLTIFCLFGWLWKSRRDIFNLNNNVTIIIISSVIRMILSILWCSSMLISFSFFLTWLFFWCQTLWSTAFSKQSLKNRWIYFL